MSVAPPQPSRISIGLGSVTRTTHPPSVEAACLIAREIGAPVVEGVTAAVKLVEALVGLGLGTSKIGELAFPLPKAYRGALRGFAPGDA